MEIYLLNDYHRMTKPKYSIILTKVCNGVYKNTAKFASPPITKVDFLLLVKSYRDVNDEVVAGAADLKPLYKINKKAMTKGLDTVKEYVEGLPNLTEELAKLSGFTLNKQSLSASVIPSVPFFKSLTRKAGGTTKFNFSVVEHAEYYGAILVEGKGLPAGYTFIDGLLDVPGGRNPRILYHTLRQRIKTFYNLTIGKEYTIYYYAGNRAGVSFLSEGTTFMASKN